MPGAGASRPLTQRTSGLAITSLILAIFGCFGVTAIAAVICGHVARKRIKSDPSLTGGGLALAGLIIGYVMIVFAAFFGTLFTIGFVKGFREARMQMNQSSHVESTSLVEIPDDSVSGHIDGDSFTYSKATLSKNMGLLSISDGEDFIADREVKIFLFPKPGESLENRTWKIDPETTGSVPHVHLRWEENGAFKTDSMVSGYQMELTTGAIEDGIVTGSIELKITGEVSAELKGNFSAAVQ